MPAVFFVMSLPVLSCQPSFRTRFGIYESGFQTCRISGHSERYATFARPCYECGFGIYQNSPNNLRMPLSIHGW